VRKLVIVYFVLINLTGFALALLEGANFPAGRDLFLNKPSEIRMLTVSAFGGASGSYGGYVLSGRNNLLDNSEFRTALTLLIGQNIISLLIALKSFRKRKRSADYNRSSLSLK